MTPRRALTAAPCSHRARDADTVGGISPGALDQSADVAVLQSGLSTAQADIGLLQSDTADAPSDIGQLQIDAAAQASDIAQLDTDLTATVADLTSVENTLPTLQPLVTPFCSSGSPIRAISSSGTVTCEIDDDGPWLTNSISAPYVTGTTRIGVGTSAPAAALQIDAPVDTQATQLNNLENELKALKAALRKRRPQGSAKPSTEVRRSRAVSGAIIHTRLRLHPSAGIQAWSDAGCQGRERP